ncbi:hypothetical protein TorRG33x02_338720 [Trema orientale]|uniref:Uncharacterized protein n=1 Tax=Trema orientale TaxID=63057 RepID=A0A2P5AXH2_TREOI|nr:hypothetical protein TorRG33x02_338720 [Trema orientale]
MEEGPSFMGLKTVKEEKSLSVCSEDNMKPAHSCVKPVGLDLGPSLLTRVKQRGRRKPKQKEDFRAGRIRNWNEYINSEEEQAARKGKNILIEADYFWSKNTNWKVHSRNSKRGPTKSSANVDKINASFCEKESDEEILYSQDSSWSESSSENFESDLEAFEVQDENPLIV